MQQTTIIDDFADLKQSMDESNKLVMRIFIAFAISMAFNIFLGLLLFLHT